MEDLKNGLTSVRALLLAAWLLAAFSAPTSAVEPGPRYGGTLRIGDQYEGVSLGYPPKNVRVSSNRQVAPAVEPLFHSDKTGKPVPWLATNAKEDAKGKTVTLVLRKGVKFHDGTAFNADAVKWNLTQQMSARSSGTEKFRSLDVIDDYTIRINLSEWDNTIPSNLSQSLGMMVSPTAYKKNGEDWSASHPVGTGPFQFVSWEKDVRTTFKRFDGYWQRGKPYLDAIEYVVIADSLTRQLSLKKGEIDLALTLQPRDLAGLEKEGYVVRRIRTGSGAFALIPDSANPKSPFADVRVRQAAQYAIDTEAIVKSILSGEAEPANQWIYKGHWGHNPSVVGYPYNPAKARELLAAAGYRNGFKTRLLYRTSPQYDQIYGSVQGYLKAVGIEAEMDPAQSARYDQLAFGGGKWEGLVLNTVTANPDVAGPLAIRYAGGNMYYTQMLAPPDYVNAIQNAVTAPNFSAKQKWVREAMKLMIDKYCLQLPIYCPSDFSVSRATLHNHGFMETPNTTWWTPEDAWLER